jgi:hypothetical protein
MFIGHSEIVAFLLFRFDADKPAPLLRSWILPLYNHKLLSASSPSRHTQFPRSFPRSAGADPPAPSIQRGLVLKPEEWLWSSFRHYAYGEPGPVLVNETRKAKLRIRKIS